MKHRYLDLSFCWLMSRYVRMPNLSHFGIPSFIYLIHILISSVMFFQVYSQYQFWFIGPFLAEMAHQSPIGCFCQFRFNTKIGMSKCAIIGRKWFPKCANFGAKIPILISGTSRIWLWTRLFRFTDLCMLNLYSILSSALGGNLS